MNTTIENALNLIASEDYKTAQTELKKLIALFPDKDDLYNLYAYCNKCIEDICEREDSAAAPTPAPAPEKLNLWEKSHPDVQRLADQGKYKSALTLLGLIKDDAAEEKNHFFFSAESHPLVWLNKERAICSFLMGDKEEARSRYLQALDEALHFCSLHSYRRVPILIKQKKFEDALRITKLRIITGTGCEKEDLLYMKYKIHQTLEEAQEAQRALQDALHYLEIRLQQNPLSYLLYEKHANWLIEAGDLQKALAQNAKAIALWPGFYGYRVQRAEILARLGLADQSRQQLEDLEKGNWYRLDQYRPYQKAKVYECLGDLKTAEKYYSAATLSPRERYEHLCDFYKRHHREKDIARLRRQQRKEPHFQDRVSESELVELI